MLSNRRRNDVLVILLFEEAVDILVFEVISDSQHEACTAKGSIIVIPQSQPYGPFYGTLLSFQGDSFEGSQNGDVHKEGDG